MDVIDKTEKRVKAVCQEIGLERQLRERFPNYARSWPPRITVGRWPGQALVVAVIADVCLPAQKGDEKAMEAAGKYVTGNTCALGLHESEIDARTTRELASLIQQRFHEALPRMRRVTLFENAPSELVGVNTKE